MAGGAALLCQPRTDAFASRRPRSPLRPSRRWSSAGALPARPVQTVSVPATPPHWPPPARAALKGTRARPRRNRDALRRSEELISQGDIAGGRLLLTRAAEAGDARSALALGATYDPPCSARSACSASGRIAEKARAWYAKAAESGSGEATKRLEVMAQGR